MAEKALEQSLQMNGFSPECVPMCLLRLPELENDLKHSYTSKWPLSPISST